MRTYEAADDPSDVTRTSDGTWHVKRGARVRVRTYLSAPAVRHYVALIDPLPAGLQALDTALAVTPALPEQDWRETSGSDEWREGLSPADRAHFALLDKMREVAAYHWYDQHSLRDHRVQAFAAHLPAGVYVLEYFARALTAGTFIAPAPIAEEMHAPETFGRDRAVRVVVEGQARAKSVGARR